MNRHWYRRWLIAPSVIVLVAAAVTGVIVERRHPSWRGTAATLDGSAASAARSVLLHGPLFGFTSQHHADHAIYEKASENES